jgi:hypothetical protein
LATVCGSSGGRHRDFRSFTGTLSDDGSTIVARWEKSSDGSHWDHDFDLIYTRVT